MKVCKSFKYFKGIFSLVLITFVLTSFLFTSDVNAEKEMQPVASIKIDDTQLGFIVGGSWGGGILTYKGVDYAFKIKGLKVGTIGVSKVSAVGNVYNMSDLSKFSGTYVAGQAGIALAGGVGGTILENQNKVVIKLTSTQQGVALNLGIDGIQIDLKEALRKSGEGGANEHTVRSGENLYEIALKYGTTVDTIKQENSLNSNTIYPGEILIIP
ncbi:MAG: LysM peptidoglycan-binding domain-containing protein [Thermodesulfobacteriota bacterium]